MNLLGDDIEVGQRLVLECSPVDARVAKVVAGYVYLQWPWREVDPNARFSWSGELAFPVDLENFEWMNTPWRLEPDPDTLSEGDSCMVGIPVSEVLVRAVRHFDPPRDLGWLPRPTVGVSVVPIGEFQDDEEAGFLIYLDGPEPISISRAG